MQQSRTKVVMELLFSHIFYRLELVNTGIVHENVHPPKGGFALLEQQLPARPAQNGQDADAFLHAVVRQTLAAPIADDEDDMPAPSKSAYDALKDYIGMFNGEGETNWFENTGEQFTDYVVEKHHQGKLEITRLGNGNTLRTVP